LRGDLGKLEDVQEKVLRTAYHAQGNVIDRLRDLLTVVDIEEGRAVISKESISLESLWGSIMSEFRKECQLKKIKFDYQPADELMPKVFVDRHKIKEVFIQLLRNAVDYTPEGGKIAASFSRENGQVKFQITDNGVGIPKVEQPRIFTKFFRASNASAMVTDRSGIGLAIAKFYIMKHGGKIGFTSREGKGSTFWFEIPVSFEENKI